MRKIYSIKELYRIRTEYKKNISFYDKIYKDSLEKSEKILNRELNRTIIKRKPIKRNEDIYFKRKPIIKKENEDVKINEVCGLLNKITPNTINKLSSRIINLIRIIENTDDIIELIYKKCINDKYYCETYIELCQIINKVLPSKMIIENLIKKINNKIINEDDKIKALAILTTLNKLYKFQLSNSYMGIEIYERELNRGSFGIENISKALLNDGIYIEKIDKKRFAKFMNEIKKMKENQAELNFRLKCLMMDLIELYENKWINKRRAQVGLNGGQLRL